MNCVKLMIFLKLLFAIRVLIRLRSAMIPSLLFGFLTSMNTKGRPLINRVISGLKASSPFSNSNSVTQLKVLFSKFSKSMILRPFWEIRFE